MRRLSRRHFLRTAGAATGLALAGGAPHPETPPVLRGTTFTRVVDLTHTLDDRFPTYGGAPFFEIETLYTYAADRFNMKRWHVTEHVGTHLDAPFHFSADGYPADEIPVEQLVLPLAVVDIRVKAAENPDAQVTPDDLRAWEAVHGQLPERACVAMFSGWEAHLGTDRYRNLDDEGTMHFPGFHVEAAQFMIEERDVLAIAVDTLSLDYGRAPGFATHYAWLPTNRWGMENVANLGEMPPVGATIVAAGPKIRGATGGPSRVLALI